MGMMLTDMLCEPVSPRKALTSLTSFTTTEWTRIELSRIGMYTHMPVKSEFLLIGFLAYSTTVLVGINWSLMDGWRARWDQNCFVQS